MGRLNGRPARHDRHARLARIARIARIAALGLVAACYLPPAESAFDTFADLYLPPPGPDADSGTFILVQEDDPFATETFRRTPDRLETALDVAGQVRVHTAADLRDDASVRRLEIRIFPPDGAGPPDRADPTDRADPAPIQTSAADFRRDSLRLEEPVGRTVDAEPFPHRVVPDIDLSPAYLEQALRRARAIGADTAGAGTAGTDAAGTDTIRVPLWRPGTGAATDTALVVFHGDRVTLIIGDTGIRAHTDPAGRLLSAVIPAEAITVHRR